MVDETTRGDDERPLREVVSGVVVGVVLLTAFTLLAFGFPFFWVVFPVGFGGVLPAALGLTNLYERRRERNARHEGPNGTESALSALRRRYATGEIGDAEFERRLERLLGTETVEDAETHLRDAGDGARERERAFGR